MIEKLSNRSPPISWTKVMIFMLLWCLIFVGSMIQQSNGEISCFGIAASNVSVCNGRGSCIAQDVCSCMGSNDGQVVDYLQQFNTSWGVGFASPSPNTLFSSYSMNKTSTDGYPTLSLTTKNKVQDMWNCDRDSGELILNDVPRNLDGSLYNEWSFELTMNLKERVDLTHAGVVVWRDLSKNSNGKNYYIGGGPQQLNMVSIPVNNEAHCNVLGEDLPQHYPSHGPFSVSSTATLIPLKVRKSPQGYNFYYQNSGNQTWIHLGTVPTNEVYDKVGIFIKQWWVFVTGGPMTFDVSGMSLLVPKYTGSSCNITSCFGVLSTSTDQVCSGNGICTGFNTCVCKDGFYGNNCSLNNASNPENNTLIGNNTVSDNTTMYNTTNTSNGTIPLNSTNNSNDTSPIPKYICNGISSDNSSVCSSKGNCTEKGCVCKSGYTGLNCEAPICFSISSLDKSVCNGNGTCAGPNQCQCNSGYEGESCSSFTCFGISKTSSNVCGGHGTCTSVNSCSCLTNWKGNSQCSECSPGMTGSNCSEIACSDDKTCNGRGKCDSNRKCVCSGNFVGEFCTNCTVGFSGSNCDSVCTSALNCSSHGSCNPEGSCVCSGHFSGKYCSICQDGWSGENCDYSVDVSSFSFNKNGDVISGIVYTALRTIFDCSYFIESMDLIGGSDATCSHSTIDNVFQIVLSSSAIVVPGNVLKFYSTVPKKSNSLISVKIGSGSLISNPPDAILKSDKVVVSTCDKISFDASSSSSKDRRPLIYSWSSTSPQLNTISSLKTSVITVQGNSLSVGTHQVTVMVTSQFGVSSTKNISFSVVSTVVPSISIPEETQVLIGGSSIIMPAITFPSCYSGNVNSLEVTYSVESNSADTSLKLSTQNKMLILGTGFTSITKEGNYYIKVSVKADQALATSVIFLLKAVSQPLELSFNVKDYSQGYDEPVSFEVSKSDPSSTSDIETLSIACFKISTNSSCGSVSSPYSQLLQPGQYTFNAKYSKGSRSVEKRLIVTVLPESKNKIIKASISVKPQGISNDIDLSAVDSSKDLILTSNILDVLYNPAYKWSSSDLDLTPTIQTLSYIIVPKSSLVPGAKISMSLQITDGTRSGSSSVTFTVNYPPVRGVFEVLPESGYALDEFDLKCGNGWTDPQTPLSYQYFFNDGTFWKPLSDKVVDLKSIRVKLASGSSSNSYKVPIKVVVSDSKGATTESITQVTVQNLSVEKTFAALSTMTSQVSTISSTDASNALLAIGGVSSASLNSAQKEQISKAANTLVSAVFSKKASQSSLVAETSDSAASTATIISNAIPAVTGGFISDSTVSLLISTLSSTTGSVANVKNVNFDSNTLSSTLAATNALSAHLNSRRRRSNYLYSDEDLKNLNIAYTNIVASSTKNDVADMPASVIIGNGVVGYSRKISSAKMNNYNDIIYSSNTVTLSSSFSKLIPNITSASFRFMIYDKRNAISKFSLPSGFEMFTKVIEFNIVPENSYAPIKLVSDTSLVKMRLQTLNNETAIPKDTELVCKKYNAKSEFNVDSGCFIQSFVKDSVQVQIGSTGAYTLSSLSLVKETTKSTASSIYTTVTMILLVIIGVLVVV